MDTGTLSASTSLTGALDSVVAPVWLLLAWIVTLGAFVPFLFLFLALARLSATAVGLLASTEVLFAFAVAWVWLGESLSLVQTVGAGVVLTGIVLAQTARVARRSPVLEG